MSFLMPDLVTAAVIEERLAYLRAHPDHINWMLSPFLRFPALRHMVGPKHVAQCVEYVMSNRPLVRPYYEMDIAKMPSIVTASSQGESMKFIGDFGFDAVVQEVDPTVIAQADACRYDGQAVFFPIGTGIGDLIWPNLWAVSGDFSSRILMIIDNPDTQTRAIELADTIPSGTPMKEWRFQSSAKTRNFSVNSSVDDVTAPITLTTAGDYGVHRLMTTVVRYCLKSGRSLFDSYGMQVATFSQQPIVLIDEQQMIWQTGFILESKMADHWVDHEYIVDDSLSTDVDVIAAPSATAAEQSLVDLGEHGGRSRVSR